MLWPKASPLDMDFVPGPSFSINHDKNDEAKLDVGESSDFQCDQCDYSFRSRQGLRTHITNIKMQNQ